MKALIKTFKQNIIEGTFDCLFNMDQVLKNRKIYWFEHE